MDFYNMKDISDIGCFMCGNQATEIHHLLPRGMSGSKCKDYIENLAALCRHHHLKAEHDKRFNAAVKCITLDHVKRMVEANGKF
tara:strand:+ start:1607 stop:1858 length:252 start_codon:yes stop_codon:yes gene_type:complete